MQISVKRKHFLRQFIETLPRGRFYGRLAKLSFSYYILLIDICKDNFQMKSNMVFRNGNATLTCDCPAVPTPSYTWQKDGNPLSFTGKELVITNAQKSKDDGKYVCIVNSGASQVKSLPHVLDVLSKYNGLVSQVRSGLRVFFP